MEKNTKNDLLPVELCLRLKEAGFNIPVRDVYIQVFENENYIDCMNEDAPWLWKLFKDPILLGLDDYNDYDLPNLLPDTYSQDQHWKWYLDETWDTEEYPESSCIDTNILERNWNIDPFLILLRQLGLHNISKEELGLLRYLVVDKEFYNSPDFDMEEYVFDRARIFLDEKEITLSSDDIQDLVMSYIKKEKNEYNTLLPNYKKTYYVDTEDFPIFPLPKLCSAPGIQDILIWFDTLGIHVCTTYEDGVWSGYLSEHPSTKSSAKSYVDCMWNLIDDSIDYLNIIRQ